MLKKLSLVDFTLFAENTFEFGALNVVHGENSSGKTHLLKLAYCLTSALTYRHARSMPDEPTKSWLGPNVGAKLSSVFRPDAGKIGRLARRVQGTKSASVRIDFEGAKAFKFGFSTRSDRAVQVSLAPKKWLVQAPVYLPTRELLSIYPGFVSLYETQAIPFDETWRDTCLLLGAPVARGPKKREIAELLAPLEMAIGCKASLEGDKFFLRMEHPKSKVESDLVAEGYRKLSMMARLIANGSLDDKGYLFWDEPEANLNPRLVRRLAPLLLDLAAGGVQVFIATHSLFLMRELEIAQESRTRTVDTRYIGLFPSENGVQVEQGTSIEDSGDIAALDESIEQSDRYLEMDD